MTSATRPATRAPLVPALGEEAEEDSTPQLPSENLLGVWYADEYVSSPRRYIPNAVSEGTPSASLFGPGRRMFARDEWWTSTVAPTDDAATAPDSSTEASTVSQTGNWTLGPAINDAIPAGTYTVAINAKRNTGSDQSFCFTPDNTATRSDTMVATDTWQRFSYTFVLGSPSTTNLIRLCSIDGSTAADLQICDFELYAGSSDLGPQEYDGHLYLGRTNYSTVPTAASGWLDLSAGGTGIIQLAATQTLTTFTAMAVVSKVAAGSAYQAFLSKVQSFGQFSAMTELSNKANTYFESSGGDIYTQFAGMWTLLDAGAHVIGCRYDDSVLSMWLDDILLFQETTALGNVAVRDFYVGIVNTIALTAGFKLNSMALWSSALSNDDYRTAYTALKNRAAQSSITLADARVLVAEGDSITGDQSYCYPYAATYSPGILGVNLGVSGSSLANLVSRASVATAVVPPSPGSRKFIASVLIGANDLRTYPGATDAAAAAAYTTALFAYYATLKAAGFLVVGCTILPVSGTANDTEHNARRAIVNANIVAAVGDEIDAVADFADDATMGPDDSFTESAEHWTDGVHPDASGHAILAPIYAAAVNSL